MKRLLLLIPAALLAGSNAFTQCEINASANPTEIVCGQSVSLSAFGSSTGQLILDENFNSGSFGPGWSSTPGSTNFSNPCSPNGVDGTPHAWMDNNTSVPRTLTSAPYNLSGATAGVTICFDLLFAQQGNAAPCEGPDEPDEGVYLQYSIDGGTTWVTIHYFDPNGGNDPMLTNWNNWCFALPAAALTSNTLIRWHQTADSGADYDHWGIDNVQIFQNDLNSEIIWLHDGYSYGLGSPGGVNPNTVTPTTTTTYTAQITTGTGQVCTTDITIIVNDPVYDVQVTANPTTICSGDCATISGSGRIILDPGGLETYENNEFSLVASGSASVNINVQGINTNAIVNGLIDNVTINGFNFSGSFICTTFGGCNCNGSNIGFGSTCNLTTAGFTVTLTSPGGCQIILVPAGVATGNYNGTVFVPVGGTTPGSTFPSSGGPWDPNQPFSDLNGCDPNGVWTLSFDAPGLGFGIGTLQGWSITFNDPPIYAPVEYSWSPTNGLSDPDSINTQACPTATTNYELTVSNGTPGCATHTENIHIIVDPCGGCVPPAVTVNQLNSCAPASVDLTNAIASGSAPATLSYHASQNDAQNDSNPINTIITTSGTYWVRYEDPNDPTCFGVAQIDVTITTQDDPAFALNNFCVGTANQASGIATPGGTFTFNPVPSDGATIDPATGAITNASGGNTYTVEYTTNGICPSTTTQTIQSFSLPTPVITGNLSFCSGNQATLGTSQTYTTYSWSTGENTPSITTGAQNGITVSVVDANGCTGTSSAVNVTEVSQITTNDTLHICQGQSILIHGTSENTAGDYTQLFTAAGGCDSISTVVLIVHANPTPAITGNLWYCEGTLTSLDAGGPYSSYSWSTGDNQQVIQTNTGSPITVTVTDNFGCSGTSTSVSLTAPPVAIVNATPASGTAPLTVTLTNNSQNASSYYWEFGNGNTLNTANTNSSNQQYDSTGQYTVMLVAYENGCSDTAYVTIVVLDTNNDPAIIEFPNIFTPNGDHNNDYFEFMSVNIAELKVIVTNRWGNTVFESDDIHFQWDGHLPSGEPASEGVYFYQYQVTANNGEHLEGHQFVQLIR